MNVVYLYVSTALSNVLSIAFLLVWFEKYSLNFKSRFGREIKKWNYGMSTFSDFILYHSTNYIIKIPQYSEHAAYVFANINTEYLFNDSVN